MTEASAPKPAELQRLGHELELEHRDIRGLLAELSSAGPGEDVLGELDRLHELLLKHFAHEQYPGGFYESLGACAPQFREDLRVLVDEHFLIVTAVHSLRERARHRPAGQVLDLRPEIADVVDRLKHHEQREHDMVERLKH